MSKRSAAQRIGKTGERMVESLFDEHPRWVARHQGADFGIDLEVELARESEDEQLLQGQLLKIQVKSRTHYRPINGFVAVSVERRWLNYACNFRIPVILVACSQTTGELWWVWLQEWALLNEEALAVSQTSKVTVRIPLGQSLKSGLDVALPAIAEGTPSNAMVLALRGVLEVARGWENQIIARGVVELLGRTEFPSRDWTINKIVDRLLGFGSTLVYWQAQETLPILFAVIEASGGILTSAQILRMVQRGELYSRAGINALARVYDCWPVQTAMLGLPKIFAEAKLEEVAWYAAIRERFPGQREFGLSLLQHPDGDLSDGNFLLRIDQDLRDYLFAKWPNRGDSVLLDRLSLASENELVTD